MALIYDDASDLFGHRDNRGETLGSISVCHYVQRKRKLFQKDRCSVGELPIGSGSRLELVLEHSPS
jgi:hypothetical protein